MTLLNHEFFNWIVFESNFILEMPKLSGLDQKQRFTTETYPKGFGIPKMKLDFQNIGNSEDLDISQ